MAQDEKKTKSVRITPIIKPPPVSSHIMRLPYPLIPCHFPRRRGCHLNRCVEAELGVKNLAAGDDPVEP